MTVNANAYPTIAEQQAIAKQIYSFFLQQGLTSAQACGIVANAEGESTFRSNVFGDDGKAYGLWQPQITRRAEIKANSPTHIDMESPDVLTQCAGVWWELNNLELDALHELRATFRAYDAGAVFCTFYERPKSAAQADIRGDLADKWLAFFNPPT